MHCAAPLSAACAGCGAELPSEARFCPQCAQPTTASPGTSNLPRPQPRDPRTYTPRHLADKILQSRSALEGERKQVTVLFADVKSSMQLAEDLDPEEWHVILDGFFAVLTEGVHRFEGTVNQYTGDGVMAIFGAPIAHEDHAQRACYAALHLRDALKDYADALRVERGLNFSIRMGLNSGEVVVGKIGDDLRMDYTAQGHTVGLAQRMESLAEPGKAMLAQNTIDIVRGYFALRDLGEARIKGLDAPLRVAELEGIGPMRTRLDRSRARGLSKFVGRDEELSRLLAALDRAIAGDGQVIGIVAEAGAGKSRLCHELAERCRSRGIPVRSGRGVSHGSAVPLEPILHFYREIFGIEAEDGDAEARQKIAGLIAQISPAELDALPLLFDFMRVPDPEHPAPQLSPDERSRALIESVRRLTVARSARGPAFLLFEDLHWVDPESAAFIEALVDTAAETRTLLVLNFRPEFRADWMGRTHYQQIALRPLDSHAAAELLRDWLGPDPSLEGFVARVQERTAGNPFFMEEVVQAQVDAGVLVGTRGHFRLAHPVDEIEVPASVQSLLAARIDRLREEPKELLQTAAVIADDLDEPLLAEVSGRAGDALRSLMRELVQAEFLYEQSLYPELEYAFKHPLTREVAYGSMLHERRREVHARTAEALEKRTGDGAHQAPLLAHHFEEGGRPLDAARWHAQAALPIGHGATRESLFHWRKIVQLLEGEPKSPERDELLGRARATMIYAASRVELPEHEVSELFEVALRSLDEGDARGRTLALLSYAVVRWAAGDRDEAMRLSEEAAALGRRAGDREATAVALATHLTAQGPLEEPRSLLAEFAEIEELCSEDPHLGAGLGVPPLLMGGIMCALAGWAAGRGDASHALVHRLVELFGADERYAAMVDFVQSRALSLRGDHSGACEVARRGVGSARDHEGGAVAVGLTLGALGFACVRAGFVDEALDAYREAVEINLDRGLSQGVGLMNLAELARAQLQSGNLAAARESIERGLRLAAQMQVPGIEALIRTHRAQLLFEESGRAAAAGIREELERAEANARERSLQQVLAMTAVLRADLASLEGDEAGRTRALAEAARLYRSCGDDETAGRLDVRLAV